MRMLWIASGLAMVLLTCAAIFRQKPADDVVPSGSPEIGPVAPGPLTPEDVSQIVALRAQFGGPADRFGGKETSLTAFEQELRQVAGVEGNVDESPEADGSRPALLRQAASEIDRLANRAEEASRYAAADEMRTLADQVRRLARVKDQSGESAAIAADPAGSLIDNGPAPQAQ